MGSTPLLYLQYSVALERGAMSASARLLRQDECLACQAIWAGRDCGRVDVFDCDEIDCVRHVLPQHAHMCLACPECHERPIGVAIYVGAYCYRCGWREGDRVGHQGEW